jgi:hypothetical protein
MRRFRFYNQWKLQNWTPCELFYIRLSTQRNIPSLLYDAQIYCVTLYLPVWNYANITGISRHSGM